MYPTIKQNTDLYTSNIYQKKIYMLISKGKNKDTIRKYRTKQKQSGRCQITILVTPWIMPETSVSWDEEHGVPL